MSDQYQCPNCGGYKNYIQKPLSKEINSRTVVEIIAWSIATICTFGLALLIFIPYSIYRNIKIKKGVDPTWNFTCNICGLHWSWVPGTQYPDVKMSPELIQLGSEKLEEEAQRRRTNS